MKDDYEESVRPICEKCGREIITTTPVPFPICITTKKEAKITVLVNKDTQTTITKEGQAVVDLSNFGSLVKLTKKDYIHGVAHRLEYEYIIGIPIFIDVIP